MIGDTTAECQKEAHQLFKCTLKVLFEAEILSQSAKKENSAPLATKILHTGFSQENWLHVQAI